MYSGLHSTLQTAREGALSWVCWRMPGEAGYQQLGPAQAGVWDGTLSKERSFVFAPFDLRDNSPLILSNTGASLPAPAKTKKATGLDKAHYIQWVNSCLAGIRSGRFRKLVGARIHQEQKEDFDAVEHFLHFSEKYPNAFCYLWHSPSSGTWLGATPELFLDFSPERIRTVALAGTQPNSRPFGEKEEEEQQLVVDYVKNALQPFVKKVDILPKSRINSGHLVHLVNEMSGVPLNGMEKVPDIIRALHPTPAVAGIPKREAVDFIREQEGFDRAYYSGFLGPLDERSGTLYVNLRCMQEEEGSQFYYVGAGLTRLSDPEMEWLETEEKRKVIAPRP